LPPLLMPPGFTAYGAVDMSFGTAGQVRVPCDSCNAPDTSANVFSVTALGLPDGKFLAAYGTTYKASRVMQFTADGAPDVVIDACSDGTVPVYRLWNERVDSNHRYTTDPAIKAQLVAKGYMPEGSGPDGVAMCAPR